MDFFSRILSNVTSGIWSIISAVLFLVVAVVVASIVKNLVLKLIDKPKAKEVIAKFDGEGKPGMVRDFIGRLVYLLVFILFVPAIFQALGMGSILSPITNMLNSIWGYVPNVIAAVIVMVVGSMIAKLVRQLLIPVFGKIKLDKIQEKAGIQVPEKDKLSNTLAYIVYVLILIPTVIMALSVLNITVISNPAISVLSSVINFIPNIAVALILVIIGNMIGKLVGQIVTKLIAAAGLDAKLKSLLDEKYNKFSLSKVVGGATYVVIVIFFIVEGVNVLNLSVLSRIGAEIILYMPAVISAVLIFVASLIVSGMAEKALRKSGFDGYAVVAKVAILIVGAFMILSQLNIASNIVNTAFTLTLAALAVAFAISFGIGGKEFAQNVLKKLEKKQDKLDKKDE